MEYAGDEHVQNFFLVRKQSLVIKKQYNDFCFVPEREITFSPFLCQCQRVYNQGGTGDEATGMDMSVLCFGLKYCSI